MSLGSTLLQAIILVCLTSILAKEPELPLCPSNMQYFPQNLPMHCRMPVTIQPFPPEIFPNPQQQPKPVPFPVALPGLPNPESGIGPIPGPMSIPGPMPIPMMPMPQAPAQKLPVIVMPFYSPDTSFKKNNPLPPPRLPHKKHRRQVKKRRPLHYDSSDEESSSTDTSDESSEHGWWKGRAGRRSNRHHSSKRRKQQNRDLLTPVLQYVTKDGYVIYEKQISKVEAKDWLVKKNSEHDKTEPHENKNKDRDSNEERPVNSINFMIRGDDSVEIKTDKSPQEIYKKKILKRKPVKITKQQE